MNDELKKAVQSLKSHYRRGFPKSARRSRRCSSPIPTISAPSRRAPSRRCCRLRATPSTRSSAVSGYHPQQELLEAVVYLPAVGLRHRHLRSRHARYVRFYLSFDNGATWQDQGMTSFQAYNVPEGTEGSKRLEYAVSLRSIPSGGSASANHLIRVRAILSWNNPPPAKPAQLAAGLGQRARGHHPGRAAGFICSTTSSRSPARGRRRARAFIDPDAQRRLKKVSLGAGNSPWPTRSTACRCTASHSRSCRPSSPRRRR